MFEGLVFKLHGDMEHADRKVNFYGFDQAKGPSLLICTDVASRGLDFKNVDWVVQWDLSSQVKEYVNRVGRTARIASAGQSLCFVMAPNELGYVQFMKKKYQIDMLEKSRFTLMKLFEQQLAERAKKRKIDPKLVEFRKLRSIDDTDEKQESLHCLRQLLTTLMMKDAKSIKDLARVAKNSSTRAYAGHIQEFRHVLNKTELNLTEYARSFGIYKVVHETMSKSNLPPRESSKKKTFGKRPREDKSDKKGTVNVTEETAGTKSGEGSELFTRRLQKSKLKELSTQLRSAQQLGGDTFRIK